MIEHCLKALAPGTGFADLKAQRQQHAGEHLALGRMIVDHQQRTPLADVTAYRPMARGGTHAGV